MRSGRVDWSLTIHFGMLLPSYGWVAIFTISQCSHEENFEWLNRVDDNSSAVKLANPKTLEFQVVRTTLLPGLLKTIRENRSHALPIKIFETSDIVLKDPEAERQSKNVRHAAAVYCNRNAGFEVVHGLLDRVMEMLDVRHISSTEEAKNGYYYLKEMSSECNRTHDSRVSLLSPLWFRPHLLSRKICCNILPWV